MISQQKGMGSGQAQTADVHLRRCLTTPHDVLNADRATVDSISISSSFLAERALILLILMGSDPVPSSEVYSDPSKPMEVTPMSLPLIGSDFGVVM